MTHDSASGAVKVLDKVFEPYITAATIQKRVAELGRQMHGDLHALNPVFLAVLNGSFFFAADLMKEIDMECEISFVKIASYHGMESGEEARFLIGLDENLKGRNIVVVEDIVDTGRTMAELLQELNALQPASIRVAALLFKPASLQHEVPLDYIGFEVPDEFLIGYGLDYNKHGRHYKHIYKIVNG